METTCLILSINPKSDEFFELMDWLDERVSATVGFAMLASCRCSKELGVVIVFDDATVAVEATLRWSNYIAS